jgi:hypothetical protein
MRFDLMRRNVRIFDTTCALPQLRFAYLRTTLMRGFTAAPLRSMMRCVLDWQHSMLQLRIGTRSKHKLITILWHNPLLLNAVF